MDKLIIKLVGCVAAAAVPIALAITGYSDASLVGLFSLLAIVFIANN